MNSNTDPKEESTETSSEAQKAATAKQQQSDPNLTELKGLIDPKEDLEVKGTDNPFKNP